MWKRKAAIAVLIVAGLLVGLVAVVHTDTFKQWILNRASRALSSPEGRFSAGSLNYDLRNLRFTLGDVSYTAAGIELRIDRASVDLPWRGVRRDPLRVSELEADGVRIRLDSSISSGSGAPTAELPNIVIDRIRITDGSLVVLRPGQPPVDLPSFSLELENNSGLLRLPQPITGLQPELVVSVNAIPVRLDSASVEFGRANWNANNSRLSIGGDIEGTVQWAPSVFLKVRWNSNPADVMGWRDVATSGAMTYSDGIMRFEDVTAASRESRVTATASFGPNQNSASVSWSAVDLSPVEVPATTAGTLRLTWLDENFNDAFGTGEVRISSRRYGQATSSIRVDGRRALLGVNAAGFDARMRADLVATMDHAISGRFRIEYPAFSAVATGSVRGTFDAPRATATVTVKDARYGEFPPLSATATIEAAKSGLSAENIVVKTGASSAQGKATLVFAGMRIDGTLPDIDINVADFLPEATGSVTVAATISGTAEAPRAEFSGSALGPLRIREESLETVEFAGAVNRDVLRTDKLRATQPPNQRIDAAGTFNINTHEMSAKAAITDFRLDRFEDAGGAVNAQLTFEGSYEKPRVTFEGNTENLSFRREALGEVNFNGVFEDMDVRFDAISKKFSTSLNARVRVEEPYAFQAKITADDASLVYRDYSAAIDGMLALAGQLQPFKLSDMSADAFRARGEGIRLEASGRMSEQIKIDAAADLKQLPVESVQLTGEASANITVSGSFDNPQIEGRVRAEKASVFAEGMRMPAVIQGSAEFNRDQIVIDALRAEWGSALAQVRGRSNIRGAGEYTFKVENVRPEELFVDLPLKGVLQLEGSAGVYGFDVQKVEARASLTAQNLQLSGIPLRQIRPSMLNLSTGVVTVTNLEVEGGRTRLNIGGSFNSIDSTVDFSAEGTTDIEVLEGFIDNTQIAGNAATNIRIRGPAADPEITGMVNLADVEIRRQSPALIATGGSGTIELQGRTARLRRISADLNDGIVTAGGTISLSASGLGETVLDIAGENIRWQYPDGLQAEVSTNLQMRGKGKDLLVGGEVRVLQAVYGRDIDITQEVFRRIATRTAAAAARPSEPTVLDTMRLNVDVRIPGEVLVLNNVANLQLAGNFRLTGTVANPVVTGRLQALEGGEIYFGPSTGASRTGRDAYTVEQGLIDLVNPRETEPIFDFVAHREVKDSRGETYQVRLSVNGKIGDIKTAFTSDPPLSEPNIIALVLTGHTLEQAFGNELTLARNQALGYLSGIIQRSDLLEGTGRALGLDTVRIDPFLIANETDLGARLTIGKDITQDFSLIFSQGLSGTQGQTWIAQYNAFKGFHLRGVNDSVDQELRAEVQHQLDFGGTPRPSVPRHLFQTRRLGTVVFDQTSFPESDLRGLVTKPGKDFTAFQLQKDIEKLESFFIARDYLNVQVRATRQYRGEETVDVTYRIQPGSRIRLDFTGLDVPGSVRQEIRESWNSGVFEEQTLSNVRLILLRYLADSLYFQPDISVKRGDVSGGVIQYTFVIDAGPRFAPPQWRFEGAEAVEIPATPSEVLYGGDIIRGRIEDHYRSLGRIDVQIEGPRLELQERQAFYVVNVRLGPQYTLGQLHFNGNAFVNATELDKLARTTSELPMVTDAWIRAAIRSMEAAYWKQGFNDVSIRASIDKVANASRAAVIFNIVEGPRQLITSIEIEGDDRSDQRFVRSLLTFEAGDPVDHEKINQTRKALYDTGIFRSVDIDLEAGGADEYIARIRLAENAPWRFRYGLALTDKLQMDRRDLGLSTDLTYSNLFGRAVMAGSSFRYDAAGREVRFFSGLPSLIGRDAKTSFSVFSKRDLSDEFFIADEIGFGVQQQWQMRNRFILSYDYNYRRIHTFERNLDRENPFAFDVRIPVARFNASLSRDTRDDILNATRGTFLSNSFELAPPGVGSGIRFVKNYGQFFSFRHIKEQLTWASAYRVGFAGAFAGEDLIPTERFAAGGSTTVRGFKQNQLTRERGNATFVVNQELRFPLLWWFSGASFLDVGNVYRSASDFNPFKLRYSPGLGLRVQTPFVMIRFDAGFNPSHRPGEDRYRFSFGIGQAF